MATPRSPIEFTKHLADGTYQRVGNEIDIASITTTDPLPVDIQSPDPLPTDDQIVTESAWTELLSQTFTATTPVNSSTHDVDGYTHVMVELEIESNGTPTNITFVPQFTIDGGSSWGNHLEGIWSAMVFEDSITASGIRRFYRLDVSGADLMRFQVTATGVTGGGNEFIVVITVRAYR